MYVDTIHRLRCNLFAILDSVHLPLVSSRVSDALLDLLALAVSLVLNCFNSCIAHHTIFGLIPMDIDPGDVPLGDLSIHNVLLDLVTIIVELLCDGLLDLPSIHDVIGDLQTILIESLVSFDDLAIDHVLFDLVAIRLVVYGLSVLRSLGAVVVDIKIVKTTLSTV